MLKQRLIEYALGLGFARLSVCGLPDYAVWRQQTQAAPDAHYAHLRDDVAAVFAEQCQAVLLVWPYLPYENPPQGATISAYYPASDAAHQAALAVAEWLCAQGFRAKGSPNIPYKPILAQAGLARYGRNGLTGMDGLGTRYALQVVLTDAPLTPDLPGGQRYALADRCADCSRCVRACPVGALDGTGRVDVYRCVRARADEYPLAEPYRVLIGRSLYGCDICQDVCPRNAGVKRQPMPKDLQQALRLEALLEGNVEGLTPYIGKNFARKARLQSKACVIAANMGRRDLLEAVQACAKSPVEFVRIHALWALEQLK